MDIMPIASGSSGNAYIVNDGETALLLDAGLPIKRLQEATHYRVTQIAGCLVTHCHDDHSKAVKDLLRLGVDVYTGQGTLDALGIKSHRAHVTRPLEHIIIGSYEIVPFDVQHDAPDTQGFLVFSRATQEKLVYFTDTQYIKYQFHGLDYIMGECNYDREILWERMEEGETPLFRGKRLFTTHMSLESFLDFLRATDTSRLKAVYVLHMSNDHGDQAKTKRLVQELTGAAVYIC